MDFDALDGLNAARTRTEHGWWAGEPYDYSFGPLGEPEERTRGVLPEGERGDPDDRMTDIWAGDPASDENNSPLICESLGAEDAAFIAALANNADELLRLARIGAQAEARPAHVDDGQD